jgi:acyl carrier protein
MTLDARLRGVLADTLGVDAGKLNDDDSPRTIPGWDSVNHIQLILALEAEYAVQFDPGEIADLNSVQAIRRRLDRETAP